MKILIRTLFCTVLTGVLCSCNPELQQQEVVFLKKRNFLLNDTSLKVKPVFIPLPAGAIQPKGWIKDEAILASHGITGHLDEWSATFGMAWKGVGFKALGADPETGMGWPLEQSSYWLDGAVRLAYILDDRLLIDKISARLNQVVDSVLNGGDSFVYWQDVDYRKKNFESWAHSHLGRALVAYYEATGNPRILEALTKVYSHFDIVPLPFPSRDVTGCTNTDPMLATYELSGDKRILNSLLKMAESEETQATVQKWNAGNFDNGHGVIVYENLRIPAMLYPWTNNPGFLKASRAHLDWLDRNHLLPFGIASSEEYLAGIGSTRNTETCNVSASAWTYQQMYEITGESQWGDRIERVFFNAAPAAVARDYQTMAYYQSPNRIEGLLPAETPGHPGASGGKSSYIFRPLGHDVLCCVGNLNRAVPNYIMHLWMATADKGIAATLYGPSVLKTVVGKNVPLTITSETEYPFAQKIEMTVEPARTCSFPIYLRIPQWCDMPTLIINDRIINIDNVTAGFVKIDRKWKKGDVIELYFHMHVEVVDGRETAFPQEKYFLQGNSSGRPLAKETAVNSPYRSIYFGPLLFALPVKDINPNEQAPGQKWNYAMVSTDASTFISVHSGMPNHWHWQIDEAPIKLIAKATAFDWRPSPTLPLPKGEVTGGEVTEITLVPYGCTKFRISMFPVAKKREKASEWE
ncbi:MAG: glycoside hydrolase family 127 protein [Tannerella sp.]|jgi:hypothetical protein|nr:glycoside hydrolase family 127 protein [Tannerella sp.]